MESGYGLERSPCPFQRGFRNKELMDESGLGSSALTFCLTIHDVCSINFQYITFDFPKTWLLL